RARRRGERRRARMAVDPAAECLLQGPGRLARAGVHASIEVGVVEPGRQAIAPRLPVVVVVDLGVLGRRNLPDVLPRKSLAGAIPVVFALDDAVRRAAAVVMRVVIEPALVDQHEPQRAGEIFRDHQNFSLRLSSSDFTSWITIAFSPATQVPIFGHRYQTTPTVRHPNMYSSMTVLLGGFALS